MDFCAIYSAVKGNSDKLYEVDKTLYNLGTMSTQDANAVAITGGTISGVTISGSSFSTSSDDNLSGATLSDATLSGATLTGGTNNNGNTITGGTFSNSTLSFPLITFPTTYFSANGNLVLNSINACGSNITLDLPAPSSSNVGTWAIITAGSGDVTLSPSASIGGNVTVANTRGALIVCSQTGTSTYLWLRVNN
jgi:hypothetical protein